MRLNRDGTAAWSSLDTYQGDSSGRVTTLRPGQARECGWLTDSLNAINCPIDPAHPNESPWHSVSLDGRELLPSSWPYMRCGGGVIAGSNNSFGVIRWPDATVQAFDGRLVGVSADGVVILTDQKHRQLRFLRDGVVIGQWDTGGIIQQSNACESDQLDVALVNGWLTVRTEPGTLLYDAALHVSPDFLLNPYARTTIPLDNGTLVEWDGQRITWRPHDSRMGLVLRDEQSDFYYLDSVDVDGELILVGSLGPGQLSSDFKAYRFPNFESLPRVDVIERPMPVGYDYSKLPLTVDLLVYKRDHAPDSSGAPFSTPAGLPYSACYPETLGEIQMANAAGVACIVGYNSPLLSQIANLKALSVRNEDGSSLPEQIDKAIPVCRKLGKALLVYDDQKAGLPANFPFDFGVFSLQTFYELNETPRAFVARFTPIIQSLIDRGVCYVDLAFSAFDRNIPISQWQNGADTLKVLQSAAHEFCRLFPAIVSVSFFDGGRWGTLPNGETVWGTYKYALQTEHRKLLAALPVGPSRYPTPPPTPETDMSTLYTWASMERELYAACFCCNLDVNETKNTVAINTDRFIGKFAAEVWPPQRILQSILVRKWPALTVADCMKDGQPLTVSQIISGRP